MNIKGVTLSINFTTLKELVRRIRERKDRKLRKVELEDRIKVFGTMYRVYDADDETFKAIKDEHTGLAEKHRPVQKESTGEHGGDSDTRKEQP